MTEEIVVIGAGGFGRETLDVIEAARAAGEALEVLGVVDTGPRDIDLQRLADRGVAYLGTDDDWLPTARVSVRYIAAIGNPRIRAKVVRRFDAAGLRAISVIHPRAGVGSRSQIGDGVVVAAGVQVSTNVVLGHHVHLNPGCIIGHDAVLEDFVSINPGAIISGNVVVGRRTLVGAGAVVLQGLTVGEDATVGAAACAVRSVSAGTTVVGVPAHPLTKGAGQ